MMKFLRILLILLTTCIVSLYFFPFEFDALPSLNTKKILAVVGLLFLAYHLSIRKKASMDKQFFFLSILAGLMSLVGFFSITYNNTPDYSYATYIVSVWVWLSAAYAVCSIISLVHGRITFFHLANYLIFVCFLQCVLALLIDSSVSLKVMVDTIVNQGEDFLNSNNVKRLYGIGASLDVAGTRFSVVLTLITFIIVHIDRFVSRNYLPIYFFAFLVIAVIGNMIARTTTVGVIVSLVYGILSFKTLIARFKGNMGPVWFSIILLILSIPLFVYLYENVPFVHKQLRFAFEGFFNLYERGEWAVASNDKLKTMYVFPDNFKTWCIGDGYFSSPRDIDPYFTKKIVGGYYMGTDVGYLRFIFYFGLIGLLAFCSFMIKAYTVCVYKLKTYQSFFLMLLVINFIVWFKVATDVFLAFSLFLAMNGTDEDSVNNQKVELES